MKLVKRLTKLFRSKIHRPERKPLTMECAYPLHGTQQVVRITDSLPSVIFLRCGCFRTRKYPCVDDDGIPYESETECADRDNALRRLWASDAA